MGVRVIDHIIVSSSHAHEAPDTMGLWGPTVTTTGRQPFVLQRMYAQAADAIKEAAATLQPAQLTIASTKLINDPSNPLSRTDDFNKDIRDPIIFDPTLTIARFTKVGQPTQTIATLVNWANHPEVARDEDIPASITAHYPHYLRTGIEDGVLAANTKYTATDLPGLGGVTVFLQGALGGQIGSLRGTHPPGPGGTPITMLSHAMERAIGTNAAALAQFAFGRAGGGGGCERGEPAGGSDDDGRSSHRVQDGWARRIDRVSKWPGREWRAAHVVV